MPYRGRLTRLPVLNFNHAGQWSRIGRLHPQNLRMNEEFGGEAKCNRQNCYESIAHSTQGAHGVDGGARRAGLIGNGSRRPAPNGDSHDGHTHADYLMLLRLDVPHAEDCHSMPIADRRRPAAWPAHPPMTRLRAAPRHTNAISGVADYGIGRDAIKTDGGEQRPAGKRK